MDRDVAVKVNEVMLEFGKKLDDSVMLVQDHCSDEEFVIYRRAVGKIMCGMLLEIMNPLYKEHPELKPSELD